jgi:hypothetical protein
MSRIIDDTLVEEAASVRQQAVVLHGPVGLVAGSELRAVLPERPASLVLEVLEHDPGAFGSVEFSQLR